MRRRDLIDANVLALVEQIRASCDQIIAFLAARRQRRPARRKGARR